MNKLFIPAVIAGSVLVAGPVSAAGSADPNYDAQYHEYSHWVLGQDVAEHGDAMADAPGHRTYRATVLGQTLEADLDLDSLQSQDLRDDYQGAHGAS